MVNGFQNNYQDIKKKLNESMNQLSTGKKFTELSEAPIDATKALKLKTDIKFNEQYTKNAEMGVQWLKTTDDALGDTVKTLKKARDLAVQGANDSLTPSDREKLAKEVGQIKEHLIELGNSKYGDKYIFNGKKTKIKPYEDSGNSITPGDYEAGNGGVGSGKINREVSQGIEIELNTSGADIGAGGFKQAIADLQELQNGLEGSGPVSGGYSLGDSIDKIDSHIENSLSARAGVGARQQRLEMTQTRLESRKTNYTQILSDTEDVDVAETIMNLKNQENVYRAALSTGARVIQPTLTQFL
jgi:flagellar hook-associated protein 3 FlgL